MPKDPSPQELDQMVSGLMGFPSKPSDEEAEPDPAPEKQKPAAGSVDNFLDSVMTLIM